MPGRPHTSRTAPPLVIVGATARALAVSAARAGWAVHAADLFGDLDLQAVATEAVTVTADAAAPAGRYPWSLAAAAASFPAGAPWCYTGGLENHPDLLDAIAALRPLAGNPGDVVRRLRDPTAVAAAAREAGLTYPETHHAADGVPLDGTFLVKPLAGAGGRGIRPWTSGVALPPSAAGAEPAAARVWQRFIEGVPISAAYCISGGTAELVGWSRQLVGEPCCHAGPFAWCGAIASGPGAGWGDAGLDRRLCRLGTVLAERFEPVGLIGVDLVLAADGPPAVIEINPRPTASMELFERAGNGSLAARHLAACGFPASAATPLPPPGPPLAAWSKAVLFAAADTAITPGLGERLADVSAGWTRADGGWPALADVPRPGQVIPAGAPVLTVFAPGLADDRGLERLRGRVARLDGLLAGG